MKDWLVPIVAIIMIGIMQINMALLGHDGMVMMSCASLIAGIVGYKVHKNNLMSKTKDSVLPVIKTFFKKG